MATYSFLFRKNITIISDFLPFNNIYITIQSDINYIPVRYSLLK